MRLSLSLVTVLVLLLCEYGDARDKRNVKDILGCSHRSISSCPSNSVCLIFGHDECKINDQIAKSSYVMMSDSRRKTKCTNNNYGFLHARLDIQPLNFTSWKVTAILKHRKKYGGGTEVHKFEDFVFDFGNAKLTFISTALARLSWNEHETSDNQVYKFTKIESKKETNFVFNWYSDSVEHGQFEFDLSANGQKLIDFVGDKVVMHWNKPDVEISGLDFAEEINRLTNCDLSEIKSRLVCYDTCNEMLPKPNSTDSSNSTDSPISTEWQYTKVPQTCPSLLWFHDTSEAGMIRHWRKVDNLECNMGYWQGEWTQHEEGKPPKGIRKFNASEELQCSSVHPERLTAQGKIVVGVCGGIGGLLFIGLIALLILCLLRKRRRRRNAKKFQFGADTTLGSGSTIGLPGKSTEREGTLRDSGTQREGGTQREEPKRAWWSPKKKSSPNVDSSPMKVDSSPLKVDSSPAKYENYTPTGTHAA